MRRIPINITGQQKQHRSLTAANQITQNMYTEIIRDTEGKESKRILLSVPGKTLLNSVGASSVRALFTTSKILRYWIVAGNKFYEVLNNNIITEKGVLLTNSGPVYIATNGTHLLIVDGSSTGYVYDISAGVFTADLSAVDADFVGGDYVVYVGGYFVVIQPGTNILQSCTAPYGTAPTTWDPLDVFSTALSDAGPLVALGTLFGQLWAFGEFSTIVFEAPGNITTGFPFVPVLGAPISMGISSPDSLQLLDNSLIWAAKTTKGERFIVRANGYTPVKISTNEIDTQISKYSTVANADSMSYINEGHSFYCLSFPTGNATIVYDCEAGEWHTRSSLVNGVAAIDKAKKLVFFNGSYIVGDRNNGNIYRLSLDTYADGDSPLVRLRRCQHIKEGMNPIEIAALYVDVEVGVGLAGDVQGSDPVMVLRYSIDGGKTWSDEIAMSLGRIGEYLTQVMYPRLGTGIDWVFEFMVSDPVPVTILGAYVEV